MTLGAESLRVGLAPRRAEFGDSEVLGEDDADGGRAVNVLTDEAEPEPEPEVNVRSGVRTDADADDAESVISGKLVTRPPRDDDDDDDVGREEDDDDAGAAAAADDADAQEPSPVLMLLRLSVSIRGFELFFSMVRPKAPRGLGLDADDDAAAGGLATRALTGVCGRESLITVALTVTALTGRAGTAVDDDDDDGELTLGK